MLHSPRYFSNVKLTDGRLLIACLSIGFVVRLVPELLAYSTPIGFDTISYALAMENGAVLPHWSVFFTQNWLLNALIVPLYSLSQVDPFLLLKVIAPLLYGLNVAGIYWFARKTLGWNMTMSVLAGVFFALQLASLRISWDLLRNTLGLGILLFALAYSKEVGSKRGFALFASLSLLAVFAHEYAAVILLVTVLGLLSWRFVKRQISHTHKLLTLGIIPALSVFFVCIYLKFYPLGYAVEAKVIGAGDTVSGSPGLFFITNYLQVRDSTDYYANYWTLALNVGLLFAVLFLPYIFLIKKGFFRNGVLSLWTGFLLVGAVGCLVIPFFAMLLWHRWMFMLVYPFTFYAVSGIVKLLQTSHTGQFNLSKLFSNKKVAVTVLLTLSLGVAYLFTPITMVYANISVPNITGTQVYFSTDPAVPYQDENSVVQAMEWFNQHLDAQSCIVLQHHFLDYGRLYLDNSFSIVYYETGVNTAISKALDCGFSRVFFVWWNQPVGWNEGSVPPSFVRLQDFGRISVYRYEV